jgi:hypothetical protein
MSFLQGAVTGAATGSMFGPVGAVAGGVIGGFMGRKKAKKAKAAERAQSQANTKQAYGIGQDTYSMISQGREDAQAGFQQDQSTTRARFAASGGKLEGSAWESATGENVRRRDDKLSSIQIEEDKWRGSEAYSLFKDDFNAMTDDNIWSKSKVGASLWSSKQQNKIQGRDAAGGDYAEYMAKVKPSIQEYEKFRFGSAEDKTAYAQGMDQRIEKADKWLSGKQAERSLANSRQASWGNR